MTSNCRHCSNGRSWWSRTRRGTHILGRATMTTIAIEMTRTQEGLVVRLKVGASGHLHIEPTAQSGQFVVHPRIRGGKAEGPEWSVSHIGTGCSVRHVKTESEARAVAEWMSKNLEIPADEEGAWRWKNGLTDTQLIQIYAKLDKIAPAVG